MTGPLLTADFSRAFHLAPRLPPPHPPTSPILLRTGTKTTSGGHPLLVSLELIFLKKSRHALGQFRGDTLSARRYILYLFCSAALWFKLEHQAADLSTCQILLTKTSMMQFCSSRQFISCSQTLVPAAVAALPADAAAQPLRSAFTKVIQPASASTCLPSLEEPGQDEQQRSGGSPGDSG